MSQPNDDDDDELEPRANSPADLGWTTQALERFAGAPRRRPNAPLSTRSAKAVIDAWLAGEEP